MTWTPDGAAMALAAKSAVATRVTEKRMVGDEDHLEEKKRVGEGLLSIYSRITSSVQRS